MGPSKFIAMSIVIVSLMGRMGLESILMPLKSSNILVVKLSYPSKYIQVGNS